MIDWIIEPGCAVEYRSKEDGQLRSGIVDKVRYANSRAQLERPLEWEFAASGHGYLLDLVADDGSKMRIHVVPDFIDQTGHDTIQSVKPRTTALQIPERRTKTKRVVRTNRTVKAKPSPTDRGPHVHWLHQIIKGVVMFGGNKTRTELIEAIHTATSGTIPLKICATEFAVLEDTEDIYVHPTYYVRESK
jgi:hypothetical protein